MGKQIPYTDTHLPCWTLDITYHDSVTYDSKGQRCLCCTIFKLNDDRTLDIYRTMDDWYKQKPNATYENIIEMEGVCNG